jgi:hypothetical protein
MCNLQQLLLGNYIKNNKMGRDCSTHRGDMRRKFSPKPEGENKLESEE